MGKESIYFISDLAVHHKGMGLDPFLMRHIQKVYLSFKCGKKENTGIRGEFLNKSENPESIKET